MADIVDVILNEHKIDIRKDNIFKLYKIDSADISPAELEAKIADRRKKWTQSVNNGVNEAFVARDKAYLEKAGEFEKILRNDKLRKELFAFYNGKKGAANTEVSELVRKYFSLISATTKIGKSEIEFFLEYFREEKKNKKNILEFLKKEHKVIVAGVGSGKEGEEKAENTAETKKKKSSIIVNLFSKETLIKLRRYESKFTEASRLDQIANRYPNIRKSLYEFLEIGKFKKLEEFQKYLDEKRMESYNFRKEFGHDFDPLVDLYNGLVEITENEDIRDNFAEFKLLVMYPVLTPYMYGIGEIKKNSLDSLYSIASEEYNFRNVSDFLVSYFNVVYDNFGIYEDSIKKIMANAGKQASKVKILDAIFAFLGAGKGKKRTPAKLRLIYALSYWPIHVLAFFFRIGKFVIEKLRYIGIGLGIAISLVCIIGGKHFYGDANLFTNGLPWGEYLHALNGLESTNFFLQFLSSIAAILKNIYMYFAIGGVVSIFLWNLAANLRKRIDLKGIERSFVAIIDNAKKRLAEQSEYYPKDLLKKKMPLIITNAVGLLAVAAAVVALIVLL